MPVSDFSRSAGGELSVGGVRASELAVTYGTPVLALDFNVVDEQIADFQDAFDSERFEISYAAKALMMKAVAARMHERGLGIDVCSLGELLTAQSAAVPSGAITFHGCGKTGAELHAIRKGDVGRVVVDNLDELKALAAVPTTKPLTVILRINTAIEAHTHEYVRTSGEESKFGLDSFALPEALSILESAPHLHFSGLHSHIGSQVYRADAFGQNALELMRSVLWCAQRGFKSETIIVGGGFGIPMHDDQREVLDLDAAAREIRSAIDAHASQFDLMPRIGIEPGRALIGSAGTTLYRVMAVKKQFSRRYAIVDGGLFENPRPALYGAYHHTICASRSGETTAEYTLCGRTCENDELAASVMLPADLRAGDVLAMLDTGAYTYSMASNYNRFPRPAVVGIENGSHRLIARPESTQELARLDV